MLYVYQIQCFYHRLSNIEKEDNYKNHRRNHIRLISFQLQRAIEYVQSYISFENQLLHVNNMEAASEYNSAVHQ